MAEAFLEEHLRRIRKMTEQVSRVRPLHDVRDPRIHSSDEKGAAAEKEAPPRRHTVRDSSRRRSR